MNLYAVVSRWLQERQRCLATGDAATCDELYMVTAFLITQGGVYVYDVKNLSDVSAILSKCGRVERVEYETCGSDYCTVYVMCDSATVVIERGVPGL